MVFQPLAVLNLLWNHFAKAALGLAVPFGCICWKVFYSFVLTLGVLCVRTKVDGCLHNILFYNNYNQVLDFSMQNVKEQSHEYNPSFRH